MATPTPELFQGVYIHSDYTNPGEAHSELSNLTQPIISNVELYWCAY